jgi:hypothetical protein
MKRQPTEEGPKFLEANVLYTLNPCLQMEGQQTTYLPSKMDILKQQYEENFDNFT